MIRVTMIFSSSTDDGYLQSICMLYLPQARLLSLLFKQIYGQYRTIYYKDYNQLRIPINIYEILVTYFD
jgi:hypothetical protein